MFAGWKVHAYLPPTTSATRVGHPKASDPPSNPGGRPGKVPRQEIAKAISYVMANGIKWRAMPPDLPYRLTAYHDFCQ